MAGVQQIRGWGWAQHSALVLEEELLSLPRELEALDEPFADATSRRAGVSH